jgi:hypothetical protein
MAKDVGNVEKMRSNEEVLRLRAWQAESVGWDLTTDVRELAG